MYRVENNIIDNSKLFYIESLFLTQFKSFSYQK